MPLLMRIAGQTLAERLIRQLKGIGVAHIVLLVDALPAELVSLMDGLAGQGLTIDIARNASDAADRLHPDETILLIDGPLVLESDVFQDLCNQAGPALVVVPAAESDARFERIDARDHWLGLARIDGSLLRDVTSELGDWALGPTLLRRAVQLSAIRLPLDADANQLCGIRPLGLIDLDESREQLFAATMAQPAGWLSSILRRPLRWLVKRLAERNVSQTPLDAVHIGLVLIALLVAWFGQPAAALLIFSAALLPRKLAKGLAQLTGRTPLIDGGRFYGLELVLALLCLCLAIQEPHTPLPFLIGGFALLRLILLHLRSRTRLQSVFANEAEGLALVIGCAAAASQSLMGAGLALLLLLVEQIWQQQQISAP